MSVLQLDAAVSFGHERLVPAELISPVPLLFEVVDQDRRRSEGVGNGLVLVLGVSPNVDGRSALVVHAFKGFV